MSVIYTLMIRTLQTRAEAADMTATEYEARLAVVPFADQWTQESLKERAAFYRGRASGFRNAALLISGDPDD